MIVCALQLQNNVVNVGICIGNRSRHSGSQILLECDLIILDGIRQIINVVIIVYFHHIIIQNRLQNIVCTDGDHNDISPCNCTLHGAIPLQRLEQFRRSCAILCKIGDFLIHMMFQDGNIGLAGILQPITGADTVTQYNNVVRSVNNIFRRNGLHRHGHCCDGQHGSSGDGFSCFSIFHELSSFLICRLVVLAL